MSVAGQASSFPTERPVQVEPRLLVIAQEKVGPAQLHMMDIASIVP